MIPVHYSRSSKPLSGRYLSFAEREEIAILRVQERGVRAIARKLGRAPSTISRELRRNAATRSGGLEYRATTAQWHAYLSLRRPKPAKLVENEVLRRYVQERLAGAVTAHGGIKINGPKVTWKGRRFGRRQQRRWAMAWSLEQIARRLPLDFPADDSMRISHEAIYQALYVQGRGALRRELTACLRTGRALRMPRVRVRGKRKSFGSNRPPLNCPVFGVHSTVYDFVPHTEITRCHAITSPHNTVTRSITLCRRRFAAFQSYGEVSGALRILDRSHEWHSSGRGRHRSSNQFRTRRLNRRLLRAKMEATKLR